MRARHPPPLGDRSRLGRSQTGGTTVTSGMARIRALRGTCNEWKECSRKVLGKRGAKPGATSGMYRRCQGQSWQSGVNFLVTYSWQINDSSPTRPRAWESSAEQARRLPRQSPPGPGHGLSRGPGPRDRCGPRRKLPPGIDAGRRPRRRGGARLDTACRQA